MLYIITDELPVSGKESCGLGEGGIVAPTRPVGEGILVTAGVCVRSGWLVGVMTEGIRVGVAVGILLGTRVGIFVGGRVGLFVGEIFFVGVGEGFFGATDGSVN